MCMVWKTYLEQPELVERELSAAEWEAVFRSSGRSLFWLAVTGGEPFLRTDLVEIIRAAVSNAENLLVVSIVTNGLATEKILSDVRQIVSLATDVQFYVVVSIDGEGEKHDRIRNVRGAYNRAVATFHGLRQIRRRCQNLHPRVETTISSLNRDNIWSFIQSRLIRQSKNAFVFAQEAERYGNQGLGVQLAMQDWRELHGSIGEVEARLPIDNLEALVQKLYYRLARRFFADPSRQVLPCYASWASVFVGAFGEVRPCIMFESVGNLRDSNWQLWPVLKGSAMRRVQGRIASDECPNCWTPCEAMQTIFQNFPLALLRACGRLGRDSLR
jgi:MoaA/NifB/PqqE/SkfB family radical SAM enzyme